MIRDLSIFQLKIFLDGLKDLILAPLSLVAGIAGLFGRSGHPGRYLLNVMRLGKRYEQWINLYGAADRESQPQEDKSAEGLDAYLKRFERAIVEQASRGGLTSQARATIEKALDALSDNNPEPTAGHSSEQPGQQRDRTTQKGDRATKKPRPGDKTPPAP